LRDRRCWNVGRTCEVHHETGQFDVNRGCKDLAPEIKIIRYGVPEMVVLQNLVEHAIEMNDLVVSPFRETSIIHRACDIF
jgi:hypothetical protein